MTEGRIGTRLRVLAALSVFMFAALGARLWFVQVLASEQLKRDAEENRTRVVALPAPRGLILDRDGEVLVKNRASLVVTVNRQLMGDNEEALLFRLAGLLHVEVGELVQQLNSKKYYDYTPVPVAFDVPKRVAFYIGEHQDEFPGVATQELTVREYPERTLAAHILGYTGQITETQLKDARFADYDPNDVVGRAGIEATYEEFLQGTKGQEKFRVNSSGRNLGRIGTTKEPEPGDNVVLSIDGGIQHLAEESLDLGMKAAREAEYDHANAGAVVVMDPSNGQILAIASNPTFDPSVFITRPPKLLDRLFKNPLNPLFNRATQAVYPPGSTFKPFVALAALKEHIATLDKFYPCPPTYQVPGTTADNPEAGGLKSNWTTANLGSITLAQSLVVSCDTVYYPIGYAFYQRYCALLDHVCPTSNLTSKGDVFQRDLETFGFGKPPGSDLAVESAGTIPTPRWKWDHKPHNPEFVCDYEWCPGDPINMSIGQGDVQATPLQLAVAYSAIANGGTVWQPHVGLRIEDAHGNVVRRIRPAASSQLPFGPRQITYVRHALMGVVQQQEGTAYFPFVGFPFEQVKVAGKTGTAEVPGKEAYSWFAAIAGHDIDHPDYVVVSLVEQGGHGSTTSAPIVRRILEGLYGIEKHDVHTAGETD